MRHLIDTTTQTLSRIIAILIGAMLPEPMKAPAYARVRARRPEADRCLR